MQNTVFKYRIVDSLKQTSEQNVNMTLAICGKKTDRGIMFYI